MVLLLEDGSNAFVFFDEENILYHIMVSNGFQSKEAFCALVMEQLPKNEVMNVDLNRISLPISALELTVHFVQEGICIVEYSQIEDGKLTDNPIVSSVDFISNESLLENEDPFIRLCVPFIFENDKM